MARLEYLSRSLRMLPMLLILLITLALVAAPACQGGDDDDNDGGGAGDDSSDDASGGDDSDVDNSSGDDTDGLPESCDTNTAPQTFSVKVLVNGEYREEPVTLYSDDKLEFELEYADVDCNLEGGDLMIVFDDGYLSFGEAAVLHGIGCSSEEEGEAYRKQVDAELFPFNTGAEIGLQDTCEAHSNSIPVDITVLWAD